MCHSSRCLSIRGACAGDNFNAASNASQSFIQRWWNWILCLFGLRETRTQYAQRHASEAGACVQDAANTASQAAGDVYDKAGNDYIRASLPKRLELALCSVVGFVYLHRSCIHVYRLVNYTCRLGACTVSTAPISE